MSATNSLHYSVCVYEPNKAKKERINVGILAYSYDSTFIATGWIKDLERIKNFHKKFNNLELEYLKNKIASEGIPQIEVLENYTPEEEAQAEGSTTFQYLLKARMTREQIMIKASYIIKGTNGEFHFLPSEVIMLGDRSAWEAFSWVMKTQLGDDD